MKEIIDSIARNIVGIIVAIICLQAALALTYMEWKDAKDRRADKAQTEMLIHKVDSLTIETQQLEQEYFELHYKYSTCCEAVIDSSDR